MQWRFSRVILLAAVWTAPAADPKLSEDEQALLLEQVKDTALDYTRSLPDFICTQVVKRYIDANGRDQWRQIDTLTVRLSYFEQKEDYKLLLVNNKPTGLDFLKVGGAASKGEFGTSLRALFDPRSSAEFHWKNWATVRRRRVAVFAYRVPRTHSAYMVSVESDHDVHQELLAGYHGEIFVDRDTNRVLHLISEAELPLSFPMKQALTTLDYDFTEVGGRLYLLPIKAEVELRSARLHTRNSVEFHSYQKFHSEATITFDTDEDKLKDPPGKH